MRKSFNLLKQYCEKENFKGWDPYDGLNSKIFQVLPFKHWDIARLAWIQGFKRSPFNFRKLLLVPKQYNAKGVGLFLNGYCNLYKIAENGNLEYGTKDKLLKKIKELSQLLISLKTEGYSGACWGYNFDWQARRLFLFKKETPTVVATSFAVDALIKAYEITKNDVILKTALSSAEFILNDLNRTNKEEGFLFSYSPLNGNNTVYNASLLGSKTLAICYHYTKDNRYKEAAYQSVIACINAQKEDGSWLYGELPVQNWIDSFHTGYNLDALAYYQKYTGDNQFQENIKKGFNYYINHFFEEDGTPKYYHNKTYPIDIHCPGQLPVTLSTLGLFKEHQNLVDNVTNWCVTTMQDKKGYFYYQMKKGVSSKIPYMRWSQAFMFYGLSYYLLENNK
ncbi:delta-aminolevulinic acid dehydratase [Flammeovirga pectinis]|uniref:Delta-aminolevulinic acid dehydratase n=1 Tax=Flammeovirga pectinis TaxID=2494373 RepID=A0A3Q9FMC5_9BACT|nr:delta-aminolevulinic acid dehydratase [Flammeovirga pectinis]AZQ61542.1 delta-aminolevulinic acid dehydratase [Flammeovirga pectinis]